MILFLIWWFIFPLLNAIACSARRQHNTIADRASIFRGESFNLEKDKYLFLVTCDYSINNGRLVLVGRRLSKKSETEKTTEESTDSSEEAVSEEENSENVE